MKFGENWHREFKREVMQSCGQSDDKLFVLGSQWMNNNVSETGTIRYV